MRALHQAWTVVEATLPLRVLRGHRHLLLAPAFLALLTLSLAGSRPVPPLADAEARDAAVHAVSGGAVRALSDATYVAGERAFALREGEVLVGARGLAAVSVGNGVTLSGWNGGYGALLSRGTLTVAAVSTPVVLRMGSGVVLVPMGMQWKAPLHEAATATGALRQAALQRVVPGPLPPHYLAERRRDARGLAAVTVSPQSAGSVPAGLALLTGDVHRGVPAADPSLALRAALLASVGDPAALQAALDAGGRALLASPEGQGLLSELLAAPALAHASATMLLALVSDGDLRLLLTLHPHLRSEGIAAFDGSAEADSALLLSLPSVDIQPDPLPQWLLSRWEERLTAAVQFATDRPAVLQDMLAGIARGVALQRDRAFWNRAAWYARAARRLEAAFGAGADPEVRALLAAIAADAEPPAPERPAPPPAETPAVPEVPTTEEVTRLQTAVRSLLREKGALLTRNSALLVRTKRAVDVRGVAFATPAGDESFSFTLDPETGMLSDIVRKGAVQSFAVSFDQFLEWIAQ